MGGRDHDRRYLAANGKRSRDPCFGIIPAPPRGDFAVCVDSAHKTRFFCLQGGAGAQRCIVAAKCLTFALSRRHFQLFCGVQPNSVAQPRAPVSHQLAVNAIW